MSWSGSSGRSLDFCEAAMPREHPHPLARVERELKVAPRHRLALIEEVDADVRALQAELERRGRNPVRAREAALRQLVPAADALEELEARHTPRLGRWAPASGPMDRALMLGLAAVATLAGVRAVIALPGLASPGMTAVLAWPQAIVVALLAANLAKAVAQIWIHGDLRPPQRQSLWARQTGLIVAAVALGALGAAREGYPAVDTPDAAVWTAVAAWEAVGRAAGFAATGIATAVFGLFGWLAITPRLITDEEIERRIATLFAQARPPLTSLGETPRPAETGQASGPRGAIHKPEGGRQCRSSLR